LPGLIADRYGDMVVLQLLTLGMDRFRETVVDTLREVLKPSGIFERGRDRVRLREGLPLEDRLRYGQLRSPVWIHEHGVRLRVDVAGGQKTGHFLDQYANRAAAAAYAEGRRVADVFAHTGAFGLTALAKGAAEVTAVEIDEAAIAGGQANAAANGWAERVKWVHANAFDWLRAASDRGDRFDLVILDPPAFTRSREAVAGALRGYKEINLRAMKLLPPGGVLVTASCSYHVSEADFLAVVADAAKDARRQVRLLEVRGQSPDHVMSPFLPESRYLKCLILEMAE
jgi:23S rRNA (cytosine1962-C5)-methyltransferase